MPFTKAGIRSRAMRLLKAFANEQPRAKLATDDELLKAFCATAEYQTAHTIATYMALPHEFDTQPLIDQALADGKRIVIPRTRANCMMEFVDYDPQSLRVAPFGMQEPTNNNVVSPENIDVIHVPGIAFNTGGYRIGYGAGYYDRFLSDYEGATISTIYAFQRMNFQPEDFDIPIRKVILNSRHLKSNTFRS